MRTSAEGRAVLIEREGMRLEAYRDTAYVWTIGAGHTSAAGAPKVTEGLRITLEEAEEIFKRDLEAFEAAVGGLLNGAVRAHEFDAYVSFAFNVGIAGFKRSTSLRLFNAGDKAGAAEALLMWAKPPEILSRRRGEYWQLKAGLYVARAASAVRPPVLRQVQDKLA